MSRAPSLLPRPLILTLTLLTTANGQDSHELAGHADRVYAVQTSRDGKSFLTADVAGAVIGWDWETRKPLQRYALGNRAILALSVSPDNRQFAACSADGKVFLCDLPSRHPLAQMGNAAPGVVTSFAATPEGRFLFAGDQANSIRLWDAKTGAHVRDFGGAQGGISAIALDPSQSVILAASMDGVLRGWNIVNAQVSASLLSTPFRGMVAIPGESMRLATLGDDGSLKLLRWPPPPPQNLQGHSNHVAAVAVSPDGKSILTGGLDQQLNLSNSADGAFVRSFAGQSSPNTSVAFNADGTLAAAANQAGIVKCWNVADGAEAGLLAGHTGAVYDIAFHAERNELASAGHDGTIRIWDAPTPFSTWQGATGTVAEIAASPNGERVVSVGADKAIRIWNAAAGRMDKTIDGFEHALTAVAFSPDDQWLAAGDASGQIHLRKAADGSHAALRKAYDGAIGRIAWKPDGKQLVVCGPDGKVKTFPVPFNDANEPLKILDADAVRIYDLVVSADGSQLFTAGEDKLVKVWSAEGQLVRQFGPYPSPVRRISLAADGAAIAALGDPSGGQTHALIWNVADGQAIRDLDVGAGITGGGFLPDGSLVVFTADRKARRYDVKTPLLLEQIEFAAPVTAGRSLPDGKTVVVAGADNKLYRSRLCLKQILLGHQGPVRTVVFDGDDVLSGGDDHSARRWSVSDRTVRQSFTGHTAAVLDVARNDALIATVCADANLRLYPRSTAPEQLAVKELAPAATFKHPTVVRTVAAIGSQFVTGSDDSLLRRWDPKVGELERLSGHAGQILSLAACPDGRFVSGATDNTARRWTPAVVDAVAIDSAQGVKLAGSVDGKTLAVVGRSPERLSIWRVAEGLERIAGPLDLPAATDIVAVHAEAGLVATAAAAELSVWNLTDLKKLTAVAQAAPVAGLAFLQHGKRLTVASGPMLFHYDVAREEDAASLSLRHDAVGHANNIVALGAAPDDRTLWTAAQDNVVRVFSSAAPTPRHVLADATGPVYSAAYSADGRWLATGGADGTLRIWNAATGELAHRSAAQAAAINQVAFSVAGELLVTGSEDGIVRIWKVSAPPVSAEPLAANVEPLHEWICADGDKRRPVRSILISADLNWVLAGTSHGEIFAWKTQDPAAEPLKLEAHNASITALRFSPANSRLASFDAAGHAAIWTPGNWAYLAFQRLPGGATTGAYGPDGVTWITGDRKGSVRIVPVTPPGR